MDLNGYHTRPEQISRFWTVVERLLWVCYVVDTMNSRLLPNLERLLTLSTYAIALHVSIEIVKRILLSVVN